MRRLRSEMECSRRIGKIAISKPWKNSRHKILRVESNPTKNVAVQTTELATTFSSHLCNILQGPQDAISYKAADVFTGGYNIIKCDAKVTT